MFERIQVSIVGKREIDFFYIYVNNERIWETYGSILKFFFENNLLLLNKIKTNVPDFLFHI